MKIIEAIHGWLFALVSRLNRSAQEKNIDALVRRDLKKKK